MKFKGLDFDPSKLGESVTVKPKILNESGIAFKESTTEDGMRYLLPRIEAIHAGSTRNSTRYPAEKLRGNEELGSGVYSWLKPYPKPVIYNHDTETEASGRIQAAAFAEYTAAGRPGIVVVPKITQAKAIDDILGGRLLTVSIGATTDAAICSVCGTDILEEGYCGHMKGEVYDGVKAEWIAGNLWFDELSWVNVPADQDAMIVDGGGVISTAESFAYNGKEIIDLSKKHTEWLVDSKTVLAEGLQPEEGALTLTEEQIKQMKEDLENAQAEVQTLTASNSVLTVENEQLKTEVVDANTAKEAAEATLTQVETKLATTETSLEATTQERDTAVAEKEDLQTKHDDLVEALKDEKEARDSVVEENARLSTDMHKAVAERVVDLRVSLGKESNREEAILSYVGRTAESLNDSLVDLLKEAASVSTQKTQRQVTKVENPAGTVLEGNQETQQAEKKVTVEEAMLSLFRGPGARK